MAGGEGRGRGPFWKPVDGAGRDTGPLEAGRGDEHRWEGMLWAEERDGYKSEHHAAPKKEALAVFISR